LHSNPYDEKDIFWCVSSRGLVGLHRTVQLLQHQWLEHAAAMSLQLCPTLCDPIDGLLQGSSVPGILQARTLEWGAIAFSGWSQRRCHFLLQCMKVKSESEVAQLCPTLSDLMDCSLPGSSVHGIFPGKSTGVGCHCLLLSGVVGEVWILTEYKMTLWNYWSIFMQDNGIVQLQYVFFLSIQMLKYLGMIFRDEVPCLQHTLKWFSKNKCVFVKIKQIGKLTWLKGIKKVHFTSSNFSVGLKIFLEVEKPHSGILGMTLRNIYMCVYACIRVCVCIYIYSI